jgi:drug/metabolite transporter (DMT)-like permease
MARKSRSGAFGAPPRATGKVPPAWKPAATPSSQQGIPEVVANRRARRIAITTGIPTLLGIAVFVASYLLVSRQILDIPPGVTLLGSGACFLLGLLGLSYGVFSSSWENSPGTLLGAEQIVLNLGRLRAAISGSPKR